MRPHIAPPGYPLARLRPRRAGLRFPGIFLVVSVRATLRASGVSWGPFPVSVSVALHREEGKGNKLVGLCVG